MNDLSIVLDEPAKSESPQEMLQHISHLVDEAFLLEEGVKYNQESGERRRYLVLKIFLKEDNEE
jgi:hypothetical protein